MHTHSRTYWQSLLACLGTVFIVGCPSAYGVLGGQIPLDRALVDADIVVVGRITEHRLPTSSTEEITPVGRLLVSVIVEVEEVLQASDGPLGERSQVSVFEAPTGMAVLARGWGYGACLIRRHNEHWIFASPGEYFVRLDPSIRIDTSQMASVRSKLARLAEANIESTSMAVQRSCLHALWRLSHVPDKMDRVKELAKSQNLHTRAYATWLLWKKGIPGSRDALEDLATEMAADANPVFFSDFRRSLEGTREAQIRFSLCGLASSSKPLVAGEIDFLRRERARQAIPYLRQLLDDSDGTVRHQPYMALWEMLGKDRDSALVGYGVKAFSEHENEVIPLMKQNLDRLE